MRRKNKYIRSRGKELRDVIVDNSTIYLLCNTCIIYKSEDNYHKRSDRKSGYYFKCKECQRIQNKEWRTKNKTTIGTKNKDTTRINSRAWKRQNIIDYLQQNPCVDCGIDDIRVLEFDHVFGDKSFGISQGVMGNYRWEDIKAEICKCEVRCANCHRIKTSEEGKYYRQNQSNNIVDLIDNYDTNN